MRSPSRLLPAVAGLVLAGLATSCASVNDDLERVARDWAKVVRASQVIPVYPLTEDLQPGDVFVVDRPPVEQARDYDRRGFLPLDQLLTRLPVPDELRAFYGPGFFDDRYAHVPHDRPAADEAVPAPRAAFPSFTFEVRQGRGLDLAIPVQGVPVGLALMQASAARGSLQIGDAHTYGLGIDVLRRRLDEWALEPTNRRLLRELAARSTDQRPVRLRVVQRVHVARSVVVSMLSTASVGAAADGGARQSATLLAPLGEVEADYLQTIAALEAAVQTALPGGQIRIAQATARSVTLSERFDRPLAVGYLGFDVPVLKGGLLGPPAATLDMLESGQAVPVGDPAGVLSDAEAALQDRYARLRGVAAGDEARADRTLRRLMDELRSGTDGAFDNVELGAGPETAVFSFLLAATRWTSTDDPNERAYRVERLTRAIDAGLGAGDDDREDT